MLPPKNRLKKKTDFERVFRKGKAVREDFLLLKFAKNNLETSRFGFVVGQKISKKAVLRNKVKRRLRETVKKKLSEIKPGFDGVWVALKGSETQNFEEIKAVVKKILQKSKLT